MRDGAPIHVRLPLISVVLFPETTTDNVQRCVESILKQKTKFPYELVIVDRGCSVPTADLCQEYCATYPSKIKFYSRRGIHDSVMNDRYRIYTNGEYVVVCRGSEEWFDENKLDRQADFLVRHNGYSICFHNVESWVNGVQMISPLKKERDYCLPEVGLKKLMNFYSPMFRLMSNPHYFHLALYERLGGDVFAGRICQGKVYALAAVLSRMHHAACLPIDKQPAKELNVDVR